MDLVAEMLTAQIRARYDDRIAVERVSACWETTGFGSRNVDRLANRFYHYPKFLRHIARQFDVYHIVDHSYAHLALSLPPNRTIATCHDTDAFRVLWEGNNLTAPLRRLLARRTLAGLQRCASVVCDSFATQHDLTSRGLYPETRTAVVPLGVHPAFCREAEPADMRAIERLLGPAYPSSPEILHVGMNVPRKRIDWLLKIFAAVSRNTPSARLIRVGGDLTSTQRRLANSLGIDHVITTLTGLTRSALAALYQRATLVLLPSEREGFGFPVLEAMAGGTPVVVTDLPVLREVGGSEARYCSASNVDSWSTAVDKLLSERATSPESWNLRRERCRRHAMQFTWSRTADQLAMIYEHMVSPRRMHKAGAEFAQV